MAVVAASENTVTIPKAQYDALVRDSKMLSALEAGGVDNWEWYGESLAEFFAEEDEE
jgi:hypothetical protein